MQGELFLKDTQEVRKDRGAYFTPSKVSAFLAEWAVRSESNRILEPSCGEASFLLAAANRILSLRGASTGPPPPKLETTLEQLVGVDIHLPSAITASNLLSRAGVKAKIHKTDFFDLEPAGNFDVVLGNPPFIRYQNFSGDSKTKSLRAALAAGVNLNGLSSSWAAFVIHASRFLKTEGRLGMVLPAELLSVHYAAPVRRFLLSRFASIRIILFERLLFEDALEDVVLLMAEGTGGCDKIEAIQVRDAGGLPPGNANTISGHQLQDDRWTATLVKPDTWKTFSEVTKSETFEVLKDWGSIYLGMVTGDNSFFCLSDDDIAKWDIPSRDLLEISPPGSRHLRELEFGEKSWQQQKLARSRCWLLYPQLEQGTLHPGTAAYLAKGETRGVDKAYKCTVRTPWWRVPLVAKADLFLTYMDHERPRLVANGASVQHLNSLYGVKLMKERKQVGVNLLPLATLNTVTLLGAEVHGRSYGGGMLKLEPREADRIPVPSYSQVLRCKSSLEAIRPHVAKAIEKGDIPKALTYVDKVIWSSQPDSQEMLKTLRQAREFLFKRRQNRSCNETNE